MANTTSINLGEHFNGFLSQLTQTGRYGSVSEAVRAGLRLLEEEEARRELIFDMLEEGEKSGESQLSFDEIVDQAMAKHRDGSL